MNIQQRDNFNLKLKELESLYLKDTNSKMLLSRINWYFNELSFNMNKILGYISSVRFKKLVSNPLKVETVKYLDRYSINDLCKLDSQYDAIIKNLKALVLIVRSSYDINQKFMEVTNTFKELENLHKKDEIYKEKLLDIFKIFEEEFARLYFVFYEIDFIDDNLTVCSDKLFKIIGQFLINKYEGINRIKTLLNGDDKCFSLPDIKNFDEEFNFETLIEDFYFDYYEE